MTAVVYAVQMGDEGPIKIGQTTDLSVRMCSLQTSCPYPLKLLKTFPRQKGLEPYLHRLLAAHRLQGEWFAPHPEVFEGLAAKLPAVIPSPKKAQLPRSSQSEPKVQKAAQLYNEGLDRKQIAAVLMCSRQWAGLLVRQALTLNLLVDRAALSDEEEKSMNGVKKAIEAARLAAGGDENPLISGKQALANAWDITYQAVDKFDRQGWFPLDRAKRAESDYGIPLRELVRPDIREAMDGNSSALMS